MTPHVKEPQKKISCDVLILEDEALMSALLKRYVASLQKSQESHKLKDFPNPLKVESLSSGWELLNCDLSEVKVAIVDLLLPQVTGVDLVRDFRKRFPNLGVVAISGMATEPMKRSLQDLLANGHSFLAKPLRKEDFFQAFVSAWNYQEPENLQQHQQAGPIPSEEEGEELWTAVKASESKPVVSVARRGLLRKKMAA